MAHSLSSWRVWYEQLRPFKCLQMFSCLFLVTSGEFLTFYGATIAGGKLWLRSELAGLKMQKRTWRNSQFAILIIHANASTSQMFIFS